MSLFLFVVYAASEARAQGWEVTVLAGWTAPTFNEQFVLSTDVEFPSFPGVSIRQDGNFVLTAAGSFAFGGSVAYFFNEHLAIEGRIDTIDLTIDTLGPRFTAEVDVLPPLPPATLALDFGTGFVNIQRLFPLSANVKARTGDSNRFFVSGGLSYLPRVRFDASQPVSVEFGGLGVPAIELARVVLGTGALANSRDRRWGFNVGAGVEIDVSPTVALVGDFRIHSFEPQQFSWQRSSNPDSGLDEILFQQLESAPPFDIVVAYFHLTAGLAFRF